MGARKLKIEMVMAPREPIPKGPRQLLLEAMKAETSEDPSARGDFRADVRWLWEDWDGQTPLVWLSGAEGTLLLELISNDIPEKRARGLLVGFDAAVKMGASVYGIGEPDAHGGYALTPLEAADARAAMVTYWGLT